MADGGTSVGRARPWGGGTRWIARCDRCGAASAIDPRRAAALEDMGVSLRRLEEQLRCSCGARRGALVRCEPQSPAPTSDGRIYLFGD